MIAEFSIYPVDRKQTSEDVLTVMTVLKSQGLPFWPGPMGTCVEGNWEQIMSTIQKCREAMTADQHGVITKIVIDERSSEPQRLHDNTDTSIDESDARVPRADMDVQC